MVFQNFLCKATLVIAFGVLGLTIPQSSFAQSISITPSAVNQPVGKSFSLKLIVSSPNQAVNAFSGTVSFPKDKLQVVSLSKTDSIVNVWVTEPSFSNDLGTVSFEGIALNPGFTGSLGKILTINLKSIARGDATVTVSDASVLANDGSGTNVLKEIQPSLVLVGATTAPVPDVSDQANTIGQVKITSLTHPNERKWYPDRTAKLTWTIPKGATASFLSLDRDAKDTPQKKYSPAIDSKEVADIEDGTWYFHLAFEGAGGKSSISTYRLNVDTTAPSSFSIKELPRTDKADPKVRFAFSATDEVSGIDHYEVSIDSGNIVTWRDPGDGIFETDALSPGQHTISVKAYDEAGNYAAGSADFSVSGVDAPTIDSYTDRVENTDVISLSGRTYPNASVGLYINVLGKEYEFGRTTSGADGIFTIAWKPDPVSSDTVVLSSNKPVSLESGIYDVWVDASMNGVKTYPSRRVQVIVDAPFSVTVSKSLFEVSLYLAPAIILIMIALIGALYATRRIVSFKKHVFAEAEETEDVLHKSFVLLREDIAEYKKTVEGAQTRRRITKAEMDLVERLSQNLVEAERLIKKEVKDIEHTAE